MTDALLNVRKVGAMHATTLKLSSLTAILLLVAFLFVPRIAVADDWSAFEDYPYVESTVAILTDDKGNVLFARNADVQVAMASITKVMTAVVALESGMPLDSVFTVSQNALDILAESSVIGYSVGETVTLNELLHGLLVHSGNDAAIVIAEGVAGSLDAFVDMMNAKAAELGMTNTHYANPHGLDQEGHYSTATDIATLGRYAMQIPLFASIVGSPYVDVTVGGQTITFANTDELLCVYPGMRGIKTGYTANANRAFLGTAVRGGETLFFVMIGADSNDIRWSDSQRLLDWGFSHYDVETLATTQSTPLGYFTCADRFGWVVPSSIGSDATARISPFESNTQETVMVTRDDGALADPTGQIGQITWIEDGDVIASRTISASGDILGEQHAFGPFVSDVFYGLDRF